MFIDNRTQTPIHADLDCSVIHGTFRNCDLVPTFMDVIRDTEEYAQLMSDPTASSGNLAVIKDPSATDQDERWDSWEMCHILYETLMDILNDYAPDGYYFGADEGNDSDFGFWKQNSDSEE